MTLREARNEARKDARLLLVRESGAGPLEQLPFLLRDSLMGSRDSWLVFLDLLEEADPGQRERLQRTRGDVFETLWSLANIDETLGLRELVKLNDRRSDDMVTLFEGNAFGFTDVCRVKLVYPDEMKVYLDGLTSEVIAIDMSDGDGIRLSNNELIEAINAPENHGPRQARISYSAFPTIFGTQQTITGDVMYDEILGVFRKLEARVDADLRNLRKTLALPAPPPREGP